MRISWSSGTEAAIAVAFKERIICLRRLSLNERAGALCSKKSSNDVFIRLSIPNEIKGHKMFTLLHRTQRKSQYILW